MSIYEKIKALCKDRGETITGVEKKLGFAKGSLSKIDKNKPSAERVQKLTNYFGVSSDYLFSQNSLTTNKGYVINIPPISERDYPELFAGKEEWAKEEALKMANAINAQINNQLGLLIKKIFDGIESMNDYNEVEVLLIDSYRIADPGTQAAVRKLLDIEEPDKLLPVAAHAKDGATPEELQEDVELLEKFAESKKEDVD